MDDIKVELLELIKEFTGNKKVTIDSVLGNGEGGLDLTSLEIVNLIVQIEDKFDIIIDFDVHFIQVSDVVREVNRTLEEELTKALEGASVERSCSCGNKHTSNTQSNCC